MRRGSGGRVFELPRTGGERDATLAVLALVIGAAGALFGLIHAAAALLLATAFGTLGASALEMAPCLMFDRPALAQIVAPEGAHRGGRRDRAGTSCRPSVPAPPVPPARRA